MVKTIMLGVRNPRKVVLTPLSMMTAHLNASINELRLTDFDERGGYAANSRINARLADFANVNITGSMSTIGLIN